MPRSCVIKVLGLLIADYNSHFNCFCVVHSQSLNIPNCFLIWYVEKSCYFSKFCCDSWPCPMLEKSHLGHFSAWSTLDLFPTDRDALDSLYIECLITTMWDHKNHFSVLNFLITERDWVTLQGEETEHLIKWAEEHKNEKGYGLGPAYLPSHLLSSSFLSSKQQGFHSRPHLWQVEVCNLGLASYSSLWVFGYG